MRMTNNILINNVKRNISRNIYQLSKQDNMLATGKRISKPSDDPIGIVDSLRLSSRLRENAQFQSNVSDAISWLESSDSALGSVNTILQRVYELVVQTVNGTLGPDDRQKTRLEIEELRGEIIDIANTTYGDRYIFGGKDTKVKPYDADTDAWNVNIFTGDHIMNYEVGAGVVVPVNILAQEAFGAGTPNDLIANLQQIIDDITANDVDALENSGLVQLQQNMETILASRAQIGARINRLEMTEDRLQEMEINFTTLKSKVEDVDVVSVIMDLKNQENVYRTSLAVGARIIQPNLMDFLR